jgi:hypothetical protein
MPDRERLTVSATEASALFDASPYVTRWMLYRRFALGEEVYVPAIRAWTGEISLSLSFCEKLPRT